MKVDIKVLKTFLLMNCSTEGFIKLLTFTDFYVENLLFGSEDVSVA